MHPPHPDSEAALENATIDLFSQLQWQTANCYNETFGTNSTLGRQTKDEVVLIPKLQSAIRNLNPDLPTDYKQTIPQLFLYNAFIILSNGIKSRIGSLTAKWEHFAEWKKINSEGEEGIREHPSFYLASKD